MIVTRAALRVAEGVFPIFKFFAAGPYRQNDENNAPHPMPSSCLKCGIFCQNYFKVIEQDDLLNKYTVFFF